MNKKCDLSRKILIFWTFFIGVGAVVGSVCILVDPSGKVLRMDAMLPFFQVLPFADKLFQNFIFSGIMLLIVNGITNLVAGSLLLAKKKSGIILGMIFGITLMLWIIIQFIIFPFNFMSTTFFIFGFLQFVTGYICLVRYKQGTFSFNENNYPNIGTNPKNLVVFFSRTNYTKKLAYQIADSQGAEILEIKTTEKISGDLGFWWCGRFAMHKWGMPIKNEDIDFTQYDEVTLCSPVWVFSISSPIREFCNKNKGKIKNVNYCITHFMNCKFKGIAIDLDKSLGVTHKTFKSYRCRFGSLKELK